MNNQTEIKYNKEQVSYGVEQLKQCQKELYEADELFYKGIMALGSAKGIDLITNEDSAINLYMPEKIVIECREKITNIIDEITTNISLIEGFNQKTKETVDKVQKKEIDKEVAIEGTSKSKETIAEIQNNELTQEVTTKDETSPIKNNPLIYGPPPRPEVTGGNNGQAEIVQNNPLLYGPPPRPEITGGNNGQAEIIQNNPLLYGPPPRPEVTGGNNGQAEIVQNNPLIYGPPPRPEVSIQNQGETNQITYVPTNTTGQTETNTISNNQLINSYPPTQETGTIESEYETIPNTGIPNRTEKNYISEHPKLIGGLAAAIGLFGLPTIISDDIEEEEELKHKKKEET